MYAHPKVWYDQTTSDEGTHDMMTEAEHQVMRMQRVADLAKYVLKMGSVATQAEAEERAERLVRACEWQP